MCVMDRTAELLELAQEWARLASATVVPAIRDACVDQRLVALRELMVYRAELRRARSVVQD